jgi:hypothetical protein
MEQEGHTSDDFRGSRRSFLKSAVSLLGAGIGVLAFAQRSFATQYLVTCCYTTSFQCLSNGHPTLYPYHCSIGGCGQSWNDCEPWQGNCYSYLVPSC